MNKYLVDASLYLYRSWDESMHFQFIEELPDLSAESLKALEEDIPFIHKIQKISLIIEGDHYKDLIMESGELIRLYDR